MFRTTAAYRTALMAALAGVLLLGLAGAGHAQRVDETKAAKIKAAYLLNFIKFTAWPADSFEDKSSPIVVGVMGDGPMGAILHHTVQDARVGGRSIVVRRYAMPDRGRHPDSDAYREALAALLANLRRCHELYLSESEKGHARWILENLNSRTVLTIGDGRAFTEAGAMLALGLDDNKIVFFANPGPVNESRLKISSKLLRLARYVKP